MSNTSIQIKRSLVTDTPPELNIGEPAYSYSSNTLFIGSPAETGAIAIGGYDSFVRGISSYHIANAAFVRANNSLSANTGGTITGDVTIQGNLNIFGGSIAANVPVVLIGDNIITLNAAINQSGTPTMNAGIEIDRGSQPNVYLLWNETSDKWQFTNDGTNFIDLGGSSAEQYANAAFIQANSAYQAQNATSNTANSGFIKANAAFNHANAAFIAANNVTPQVQPAFNTANSAFIHANSGFIHANSAYDRANQRYIILSNTLTYIDGATGNVWSGSFSTSLRNTWSGVYNSNNSTALFTFASGGGNVMSVQMDGSLFVGEGFVSDAEGVLPSYGGWIVAASGIKSVYNVYGGNDVQAGQNLIAGGYVQFGDGTTQNTSANSAGSYANSAFVKANASFDQANAAYVSQNSTGQYANSAFVHSNSAFIQANAAFDQANAAYVSQNATGQYANAAFIRANNSVDANNGGTITGDLTITKNLFVGNVFVTGQTFSITAGTLVSNDTVIVLGEGNYFGDTRDLGFAAHYNDGTNAHSGLIRDSVTKEWYLFKGYTPEVGTNNNIDINDASFKIDTLNANLHSTYIQVKGIDILPRTNIIFDAVNSAASYANSAFIRANTPSHVANSAASYANSAFATSNLAFTHANLSFNHANASFVIANVALNQANAAFRHANSGFIQSNTSFAHANASFSHANSAFNRANNSLDANNGGTVTGSITATSFITTGSFGNILGANTIFANNFVANTGFIQFSDGTRQYTANAGSVGGSSNSFGQIVANDGPILATTSNDSLQIVGESGIEVRSNVSAKKVIVSVPAGFTFNYADYGFVFQDTNVIYDYGTL